jgi:hypothetical protein
LVKWEQEYAGRGLVVIEITGGEQEPLDAVRKSVQEQALEHPVLWDAACRNHRNYGLKNWPVAYLVGTDGKVFWEGNPARIVARSREVQALRRLIEAQLETVEPERSIACGDAGGRRDLAAPREPAAAPRLVSEEKD